MKVYWSEKYCISVLQGKGGGELTGIPILSTLCLRLSVTLAVLLRYLPY